MVHLCASLGAARVAAWQGRLSRCVCLIEPLSLRREVPSCLFCQSPYSRPPFTGTLHLPFVCIRDILGPCVAGVAGHAIESVTVYSFFFKHNPASLVALRACEVWHGAGVVGWLAAPHWFDVGASHSSPRRLTSVRYIQTEIAARLNFHSTAARRSAMSSATA